MSLTTPLKLEQSLGFLHKLVKKEQVERKASLRETDWERMQGRN